MLRSPQPFIVTLSPFLRRSMISLYLLTPPSTHMNGYGILLSKRSRAYLTSSMFIAPCLSSMTTRRAMMPSGVVLRSWLSKSSFPSPGPYGPFLEIGARG